MDFGTWIKKCIAGENIPLGIPADKQNLNGLILEEAIGFHIAWRERWMSALREGRGSEFNKVQVADDALCKVGQWVHGPGKTLERLPEYAAVRDLHAEFHQCAGRVVELHGQGHFAESVMMVKSDLMSLSEKVGLALGALLEANYRA